MAWPQPIPSTPHVPRNWFQLTPGICVNNTGSWSWPVWGVAIWKTAKCMEAAGKYCAMKNRRKRNIIIVWPANPVTWWKINMSFCCTCRRYISYPSYSTIRRWVILSKLSSARSRSYLSCWRHRIANYIISMLLSFPTSIALWQPSVGSGI